MTSGSLTFWLVTRMVEAGWWSMNIGFKELCTRLYMLQILTGNVRDKLVNIVKYLGIP